MMVIRDLRRCRAGYGRALVKVSGENDDMTKQTAKTAMFLIVVPHIRQNDIWRQKTIYLFLTTSQLNGNLRANISGEKHDIDNW